MNMTRFEELPKLYLAAWKKYSIAKANSKMLDESRKSVLAKESSQHEWSEATRERKARQSKAYTKFLILYQNWIQQELELKYILDSLSMEFDYQRSMNSLRKKEIDLL